MCFHEMLYFFSSTHSLYFSTISQDKCLFSWNQFNNSFQISIVLLKIFFYYLWMKDHLFLVEYQWSSLDSLFYIFQCSSCSYSHSLSSSSLCSLGYPIVILSYKSHTFHSWIDLNILVGHSHIDFLIFFLLFFTRTLTFFFDVWFLFFFF